MLSRPRFSDRRVVPTFRSIGGKLESLSVIVPCFNESEVVERTHAKLVETLEPLGVDWELVYVDDGSADRTPEILEALAGAGDRVRVIRLSRNFGHQVAVSAGLEHAAGDAVVIIDADLQDPPHVIAEMVRAWRDGADVAYGVRSRRAGESGFKLWTASLFYRLFNRISQTPIHLDTGDFRLLDRRVVEELKRMPEHDRFLRGMVSWLGFLQVPIHYDREPRAAGTTKYPLRRMLHFAADGVTSFSTVPLRIAMLVGFLALTVAIIGIGYALVMRIFTQIWVSGWTLLFIAVLFMGSVQLIFLGVIGEYIGRIYMESKRRPRFVIAEKLGFGDDD